MPSTTELPDCAISHLSIGSNQFERAVEFYTEILAHLGIRKIVEYPGAAAFGKAFPEFWVQRPFDGQAAHTGNGWHVGFMANSNAAVDAFYAAELAAGAVADGAPGPRPLYGPEYYGCFVRDLDGNKIEASHWNVHAAHTPHTGCC